MNKIIMITRQVILVILSLCCYLTSNANVDNTYNAEEEKIARRVETLYSIVDMRYTPEVSRIIKQYTVQYTQSSSILLGQSSVYFPIIENILRERNMPEQLKYLAVVESSLKPSAKSRVGATGMWQFMKGTGRMYGLKINNTVDERKDVIKSTHSAMDYLRDLHDRFGDWSLAMAAYNCGPGKVKRAMRKAGSKDFWEIKKYLPRETRRYVPKFIAMQYMMSYYHMHDILPKLPENDLRFIASTRVFKKISFQELSKQLDLQLSTIKKLNPAFSRYYIPASEDAQHLTLPEDKLFAYIQDNGSFSDLVYSRTSVVVKKEVNTHVERIALSIDKIKPIHIKNVGSISGSHPNEKKVEVNMQMHPPISQRKSHTIKKGQSLKAIADLYGITLSHLMKTNNITGLGDVDYGDTLIIE